MWYELSSNETYLLQEAIALLRSEKRADAKRFPDNAVDYIQDFIDLGVISERLYNSGLYMTELRDKMLNG
jgi:hypothetical protein